MKAKYLKKIRAKFHPYKVAHSLCGFGTWYDSDNMETILAYSPQMAIHRYCKKYYRKHKERCEHDKIGGFYTETVGKWMCFVVKDEKGFTTYWE